MAKVKKLWLYDLECHDWTKLIVACCLEFYSRQRIEFTDYQSLAEFMLAQGGVWIAHNGGNYDNLLVMNYLPVADCVQTSQSRVMKAEWYKDDKFGIPSLILRDSYPLANYSLEYIGEKLGIEKLGKDLEKDKLIDYPLKKVTEYCWRDVEILDELFSRYFDYMDEFGARPKWTGGATAIELLATMEPATKSLLEANAWTGFAIDSILEDGCVRGGLTEISGLGKYNEVYSYDINSSYPARYREGPVPIGYSRKKIDRNAALFYVRWIRRGREIPAPVLGLGQKGYGECSAWLTREELEFLKTDDSIKRSDIRIKKTLYCKEWASIGETFAAELYKKKQNKCLMSKLFVNAAHGRFAMAYTMPLYVKSTKSKTAVEIGDYFLLPDGRQWKKFGVWSQQPYIAAYILARARIFLTKARLKVKSLGFDVYYCDTDSIHTNCPPHLWPYPIGEEIGQFKLERTGAGIYVAPKLYQHGIDAKTNKPYKRAKGVNSADIDFEKLASIASDYKKGIVESLDERIEAKVDKGVTGFKSGLLREGKTTRKSFSRHIGLVLNGKRVRDGILEYI